MATDKKNKLKEAAKKLRSQAKKAKTKVKNKYAHAMQEFAKMHGARTYEEAIRNAATEKYL